MDHIKKQNFLNFKLGKKRKKGIWFIGLAGVGKTFASNFIKKKIKDSIIIDGDTVRKLVSYDLGYNLKDRKIQITRMLGIGEICIKSKKFPIISTVYMNNKVYKKAKRLGIDVIQIERNMKDLKRIRKLYKEKKNVVSKDINYPNMKLKKLFNFGDSDFLRKIRILFYGN